MYHSMRTSASLATALRSSQSRNTGSRAAEISYASLFYVPLLHRMRNKIKESTSFLGLSYPTRVTLSNPMSRLPHTCSILRHTVRWSSLRLCLTFTHKSQYSPLRTQRRCTHATAGEPPEHFFLRSRSFQRLPGDDQTRWCGRDCQIGRSAYNHSAPLRGPWWTRSCGAPSPWAQRHRCLRDKPLGRRCWCWTTHYCTRDRECSHVCTPRIPRLRGKDHQTRSGWVVNFVAHRMELNGSNALIIVLKY